VLVLASSSPYRRQLLERLRLPFAICAPHVDEARHSGESARETALRLAQAKAQAVAQHFPDDLIIGSDQVAVLDATPLGKPGSHEAALAQLQLVRGRPVLFHTALCLLNSSTRHSQIEEVATLVHFRNYTDAQAARYLELDEPYDCAGSAKIEALGVALVDRIESNDPTALIGLPLIALVSMLQRVGVEVL
jgi:7-methyl-GTP pyrophosphatase